MRTRSLRLCLPTLLAFAILLFSTAPLCAAEAAATPPAAAEPEGNLLTMIEDSGPAGIGFLVVLGLFSIVMVTITIERFFSLTRGRLMPEDFTRELHQLTSDQLPETDRLESLVRRFDTVPMARIFQAGLIRAGRAVPEVEKAMEDGAARENATLRGRVRPLAVIGSVAPLVGLLGTVVGMIIAFRTASVAGDEKAELLAQGIYLALLTTAAGLAIAIPSMLFVAYFYARIERFFREMDEQLVHTIPMFAKLEPSESKSRIGGPHRQFSTSDNTEEAAELAR